MSRNPDQEPRRRNLFVNSPFTLQFQMGKQQLPLPAVTKEAFTNIYNHNIDDNGRQLTPTPNVTQMVGN